MPRYARVFLLGLLALARPILAQPLPDRAPMVGVALDSAGGALPDAYLVLRRKQDSGAFAFWGGATQADAAGQWSFPDAEEGLYLLSVEAPGYAPIQNLEVNWKRGAAPLRLQLMPLVDLTFKLRAPDGKPVANAPVYAHLSSADPSGQIARAALSDAGGEFVVPGVRAGSYALYLRAPQGYATLDLTVSQADAAAREVTLQAAGALRVRLSDDAGRALGGAALTLSAGAKGDDVLGEDYALLASGGDRNALVTRDGDGSIEVGGLPPGRYTPRLYLPGYDAVAPQTIEIKAGEVAELNVKVPARQTPTLTLDLLTPVDKPYIAGEVSLRILPLADNGALGGGDLPFFPGGTGGRRALPGADGRVTLFPVKEGRYRLFVTPRPQTPGEATPEATPVDVTITAQGATATAIVPGEG